MKDGNWVQQPTENNQRALYEKEWQESPDSIWFTDEVLKMRQVQFYC